MLKVAVPPLSVPVPRMVAPSSKVTLPVGVPVAGLMAVTVAVKVTDCPKTEGFNVLVSVVAELVTCRLRGLEVLVRNEPSPS